MDNQLREEGFEEAFALLTRVDPPSGWAEQARRRAEAARRRRWDRLLSAATMRMTYKQARALRHVENAEIMRLIGMDDPSVCRDCLLEEL